MSKELVSKLRPFVSAFSEVLKQKHKHGDRVMVGGVIVEVFHMNNWLPDGAEDEGVYMKLDDGIGIIDIVIPTPAYEACLRDFEFGIGSVVLAEGKMVTVNTTHSYKLEGKTITVDNHKNDTTRVAVWEITPLPDKIESTEEI